MFTYPTADNAIHWINLYPVNNEIGFQNIFALDSDLSREKYFLTFEQPGPDLQVGVQYY